jgi:hypothetical protein
MYSNVCVYRCMDSPMYSNVCVYRCMNMYFNVSVSQVADSPSIQKVSRVKKCHE